MSVHVSLILKPHAPPSLTHPSSLSQSTGIDCPASHIEFALVIYFPYSNIYVSRLFSQIIPLPPSPIEYQSLFFTSVSPSLPCMQDCCYHLFKNESLLQLSQGNQSLKINWTKIKSASEPCGGQSSGVGVHHLETQAELSHLASDHIEVAYFCPFWG